MPTQFPYPEEGWSTGNMRMAKAGPRGMDPGREFRELEGQRKRKEAQVSMLDTGDRQTGPTPRDDIHYSELERQIGVDSTKYIRDMDEFVQQMHDSGRARGKHWQNWEKLRQQYIDMWNRPDSGVVNPKEKATAGWEGPAEGPGPMRATG